MMHSSPRLVWSVAVAVGLALASSAAAQKQDDAADAARLVEALSIREGSIVADVGAGNGLLTVPIAGLVGGKGRVYATDIGARQLETLRGIAGKAEHKNIEVIEGGADSTNLSDACCDAIFMRHVYHHFGNPAAMNASLRQALKPGALLAVVDFAPKSGKSAAPGQRSNSQSHGVTSAMVIEELKASGFLDVEELAWPSPGYFFIRARR
jgi:ubiquinone/menaquinone biosynthesis C-methylase UbiE